jgi:hypothetical protein
MTHYELCDDGNSQSSCCIFDCLFIFEGCNCKVIRSPITGLDYNECTFIVGDDIVVDNI